MTSPDPIAPPVACACCGTPHPRKIGTKRGRWLARDFHYFRCPSCQFLWVEPFPGYELYDENYYEGRGPDPYVEYAREYADYRSTPRVLEYTDLLRLVQAQAQPPDTARPLRWMDYGCGSGGLLKFLRDEGSIVLHGRRVDLELAGHDIGSYADRLKHTDGFRIFSPRELREAGQFDVITCIEVVEHVREVQEIFATLARLLRPGGLLILTTGNLTSASARLAGLRHHYLLPEFHISLFNPTCLAALYRQHGLTPRLVRYDGAVQFKVVKSLRRPWLQSLARLALRIPGVTRAIDLFYGVSAMPCATKSQSAIPSSEIKRQ